MDLTTNKFDEVPMLGAKFFENFRTKARDVFGRQIEPKPACRLDFRLAATRPS